MNVFFLSTWYPSRANPLKGLFVKKHAAAIAHSGVNVKVLAFTINPSSFVYQKKVSEFTDENGVNTVLIEVESKFYKFLYLNLFWQYRILKKVYKEKILSGFKAQVIHSNVLFPSAILGDWLSSKLNLPHVITEHWSKVGHFMNRSIYAGYGKASYKRAKKITVVSDFLKNRISEFCPDSSKIEIVPNVVNTSVFAFKPKVQSGESVNFICVANWGHPKRPDLIFESLQQLAGKSKQEMILNVVGEGFLLDKLRSGKWDFKINYLGNIGPEKLAEAYQASDYFLHASDMETFSIVTAEALSTGTPVLVSRVGALSELVNEENGMLTGNTVEEWGQYLQKLTQKNFNHREISSKSQKYGENMIGERFKAIYFEILNSGKG